MGWALKCQAKELNWMRGELATRTASREVT